MEWIFLTDYSANMTQLGAWNFHILQMSDMDFYESYIKKTRYPVNLWSSSFAYMWAISQSSQRKLLWRIVDGLLVTFVHSYKGTLYLHCLPFGGADPEQLVKVVYKCMLYCLNWNQGDKNKSVLKMVNDDQLDYLKKSPLFDKNFTTRTWQGIERHFSVPKMVSLQGKDFGNIRNRVHKFYREHPQAKVELYQDSDFDKLMDLNRHWKNTSGTKYSSIMDGVYYRELVGHGRELGQRTLVIRENSHIIGMVSGSVLPTGQSWGSVVKFEDDIPGLSETLLVEFAREIQRLSPKTELMNVGSDLGSGGLRQYKLKFRPVLNLKRYQVYLR